MRKGRNEGAVNNVNFFSFFCAFFFQLLLCKKKGTFFDDDGDVFYVQNS